MNIFVMIVAMLCPVMLAIAFFLLRALGREKAQVKALEVQQATLSAQAQALGREAEEIKSLRMRCDDYLEQKSVAVTERQEMEKKLQGVMAERDAFLQQKELAQQEKAYAEKELALMQQHMTDAEKRMKDWELHQSESVKAAKASILEAGGQLSSKLLEDHKREAEAARKEQEEAAKKHAESLLVQMQGITQTVAALNEQGKQTQDKMATVWRALTTPAGAGQLAEIGLENSLKALGLEAGRDYAMQYVVGGSESGGLRPDAVIFLPQDMVMVIDSKASKFLLELAEAEEKGMDNGELLQSLAKTMNKHLQDLKTKSYESAISNAYKEAGRSAAISAIHTVMCVPSEGAIAHLKKADPEFMQKAQKYGIIVASPASLQGLLSLARHTIGVMRQSENQELIVKNVQQLMDNVVSMLTHAEKVGKGIKSAAEHFDQFSRSVNRNVLSKMRQLAAFGVKPTKNKDIPSRISGFEVRTTEDAMLIEGEAERVNDAGALEDLSKEKAVA